MKNPLGSYRRLSFEQKTVLTTVIGMCITAALAVGKFVIGLLSDYNLCSIAVYTFGILLAKLECVLGIKSEKLSFRRRNILTAVFLLISSVIYIGFTCRLFFIQREIESGDMNYVLILALISFVELGFAVAGLFRTKNKGHYYRNIKIINFCVALIAILTTQMAILDFTGTESVDVYNAYSGIGVGAFIALCAVYILIAPRVSVIDREHNSFALKYPERNDLIDLNKGSAEIVLSKSAVYGSYIYRAEVKDGIIEGDIGRAKSLWKRMHISLKIICCILSEILIFVWLIGRAVFFLRSLDIPGRLEKTMSANGFEKI